MVFQITQFAKKNFNKTGAYKIVILKQVFNFRSKLHKNFVCKRWRYSERS